MAHTRHNTESKILSYGRKERYLPGCWWLDYKVSGNTAYSKLIRKERPDNIMKSDKKGYISYVSDCFI